MCNLNHPHTNLLFYAVKKYFVFFCCFNLKMVAFKFSKVCESRGNTCNIPALNIIFLSIMRKNTFYGHKEIFMSRLTGSWLLVGVSKSNFGPCKKVCA